MIGRPAPGPSALLAVAVRTRWRILPRVRGKIRQRLRNFRLPAPHSRRQVAGVPQFGRPARSLGSFGSLKRMFGLRTEPRMEVVLGRIKAYIRPCAETLHKLTPQPNEDHKPPLDRPATEYSQPQSHAVMIGNLRWIGNSRVRRLSKSGMQAQTRGELMRLSRFVRAPIPPAARQHPDRPRAVSRSIRIAVPATSARIATRCSRS